MCDNFINQQFACIITITSTMGFERNLFHILEGSNPIPEGWCGELIFLEEIGHRNVIIEFPTSGKYRLRRRTPYIPRLYALYCFVFLSKCVCQSYTILHSYETCIYLDVA